MKATFASAAVAGLIGGLVLTLAPTAASAAPTGCDVRKTSNTYEAKCSSGDGWVMATAYCRSGSSTWTRVGPPQRAGSWSVAVCHGGQAYAGSYYTVD